MFGIGAGELLIILIFGFIIFGPDKLPEIAKTVGHAIAKFNEVRQEAQGTLNMKDFLDPDSEEPFKDPLKAATKVKDLAVKNAKEVMEDGKTLAKETKVAAENHKETLAERKARYDAERAAKESETESGESSETVPEEGAGAGDSVSASGASARDAEQLVAREESSESSVSSKPLRQAQGDAQQLDSEDKSAAPAAEACSKPAGKVEGEEE